MTSFTPGTDKPESNGVNITGPDNPDSTGAHLDASNKPSAPRFSFTWAGKL